jgi:RNA polymerase-binding transcription factor DksA
MLFTATRITPTQASILTTRLQRRARALLEDKSAGDGEELRAIEAALARAKSGDYGLCTDCGAPLPLAQLGALPQLERCILCETAHTRPPRPMGDLSIGRVAK